MKTGLTFVVSLALRDALLRHSYDELLAIAGGGLRPNRPSRELLHQLAYCRIRAMLLCGLASC